MKKLMVSFCSVIITVLLCSCGIPAQKQECFFMPESFMCDVFVTINDVDYSGVLERKDCEYSFTVTKPESMTGLVVITENGEYTAYFKYNECPIGSDSEFFLSEIISFIEQSVGNEVEASSENDSYIITHDAFSLVFPASV